MTPSALVLRTMRLHPERWSLLPHRNDDPPDRKLAIEIVERTVAARHRAELSDELPLTASFIIRAAQQLGVRLGWKHAYRVRREALKAFSSSGYHHRPGRHGLVLYRLRQDRFAVWPSSTGKQQAATGEDLLSAVQRLSRLMHDIFGERGPP